MSVRDFVSEKEVEEERKRRKEEWERVRQPGQPEEPPEPQDTRPLYERLKQQRDHKQLEYEEAHKLKNLLRGLDSEEVGFLDYVDQLKSDEEQKRLAEERALLGEVKKHVTESMADPVDPAKISELTRKPVYPSTSKTRERNKQASIVAGALKKRKTDESTVEVEEKKLKSVSSSDSGNNTPETSSPVIFPSATVTAGVRPSASKVVGFLPGLESYDGASSDDSSNSSSSDAEDSSNWMLYTAPVQLKIMEKERQQKHSSSSSNGCRDH